VINSITIHSKHVLNDSIYSNQVVQPIDLKIDMNYY